MPLEGCGRSARTPAGITRDDGRAARLELADDAVDVSTRAPVVIARELQVSEVGAMTAHSTPDVALVAVGESTEDAHWG